MPQEFQQVRLKEVVKIVPVQKGSDGSYILLEDIQDAFFHVGDVFELNGGRVLFLKNEHHDRLYPQRIASYPGEILTVVSVPQTDFNQPDNSAMKDEDKDQNAMIISALLVLQSQVSRLEHNLQLSDSKLAALFDLEKNNSKVQHQILNRMDLMLAKTERLLTQTFELHEYTLPRLFIVLPEVAYQGLNPAQILSRCANVKFRLFFLCECGGTHTRPLLGPHRLNHIHIARHEGYEITRATEFFRKYGPHILRLLQALRVGIKLANGFINIPALSTVSAMDLPDEIMDDLNHKVMACIDYLTAYQNLLGDDNTPGLEEGNEQNSGGDIENMNGTDQQQQQQEPQLAAMDDDDARSNMDPWSDIFQIEGADLRRLSSFLKQKDQDRALGNLFRTVDEKGHVKWICLDHYRSTYHHRQDHEFENEIKLYHGEFDKQLGIVRVTLTSSVAIESFLETMARAGAFNELDLHLRHYAYQDLKLLGDSLSKTNVSKLTLTCNGYRELASMGKKKLYALLKIMVAGKVRYFHFKNIKDLIPARGVVIPKDFSTVRSLELTAISLKEGHETLGTLLTACIHLAVLRLTDISLKLNRLISVVNALAQNRTLTTLALINCKIERAGASKIAALVESHESLRDLDLGLNCLGDSGCCEIIEAAGNKLERLSMPYTGVGDEAAMALERAVAGDRLKCLDISKSTDELGPEAKKSIIRLMGRLRHCTELVFPRIQEPADEACARMIHRLESRKLERLEIERSDCGDQTAEALARKFSDPAHPWSVLTTIQLQLPRITLTGAKTLGGALHSDCPVANVSFSDSRMFQQAAPSNLSSIKTLFTDICSRLTILKLRNTSMSDEVASVLCEALQASDPACRLEYLDLAENKLTATGGAMILKSLHRNRMLKTLRMESRSFNKFGSMGLAVQRFLETNRTLRRLTVSHVDLLELTLGLNRNANTLKAIEIQYVDGEVDDILGFGNFLKSSQNTLLRLVIKHARVCDDGRSLEYLGHHLKQNTTLVDLEWNYDQGYEADNYVLQRYLDRNRELWRKNVVGLKTQDLVLAGVDPWTIRAISQSVE
ncbi:hypothetical protein BGZ65_003128 [Modicella reniformis]|uniref:Uncharacterized protein n=1 Tax=Modicella reniformis TaxID=1440133 RepID=A0A9P6J991_9FUNG|nr:hypothetical protein BGZ65_003128 [Modicella reniformis]